LIFIPVNYSFLRHIKLPFTLAYEHTLLNVILCETKAWHLKEALARTSKVPMENCTSKFPIRTPYTIPYNKKWVW